MTPSLFFGSLGVALVAYGVWRWRRVASMCQWPKVTGRVTRLSEDKRTHTEAGIATAYYVPALEVTYEVGGTAYRTTRFSLHNFTVGFPGELRELLQGATVGSPVEVHYDPRVPASSIIVLPSHDGALVAVFLGTLVMSIALAAGMS